MIDQSKVAYEGQEKTLVEIKYDKGYSSDALLWTMPHKVFGGEDMTKDSFDFRDLFVLDLANNHQGDVEHGKTIIRQMADVVHKRGAKNSITMSTTK